MDRTPSAPKRVGDQWRFSLYAPHAQSVSLVLSNGEFPMVKQGDIWEITHPAEGSYAFRVDRHIVPDPLSRELTTPLAWGSERPPLRSLLPRNPPFDWQGVVSPNLLLSQYLLYELHVRSFTQDPSSRVAHPGTFLGLIEKIPHLKKLGVNAVELMPLFEWDETRSKHPPLPNYWGYNPISFFAPMRRFAVQDAIIECKTMIRELHRNGIEVILDVVYNHTGEGQPHEPIVCLRGIAPEIYYHPFPPDTTGCGNAINANHPAVQHLILESLRYWAEEFRVDGFRFDLASTLTRGPDGNPMSRAPLFDAIRNDPLLKTKKLIAEPWDAGFLFQLGHFAQTFQMAEWNSAYRDALRRFLKGTEGATSDFATALCGSNPPFPSPHLSVNFVTAHDGFSLRDLVSYSFKHNEANGEGGQDGADHNESWNCGFEGVTEDPDIIALRERQMQNFLLALFASRGIPMLRMGDEYGHTAHGNNNPYVQDNALNWFQWSQLPSASLMEVIQMLASLRPRILQEGEIRWLHSNWNERFISYTVGPFWIAFNADWRARPLTPPPGSWNPLLQTHLPKGAPLATELPPHSALLAEKRASF